MNKLNEQQVQSKIKNQETKFISRDAIDVNEYLWYVSQQLSLNNADFFILHMSCRSIVWHSVFCRIINQMSVGQIKRSLFSGIFFSFVPMSIKEQIHKIDPFFADRISITPPSQKYNLVLLDDDDELCSVHLILPEAPSTIC